MSGAEDEAVEMLDEASSLAEQPASPTGSSISSASTTASSSIASQPSASKSLTPRSTSLTLPKLFKSYDPYFVFMKYEDSKTADGKVSLKMLDLTII